MSNAQFRMQKAEQAEKRARTINWAQQYLAATRASSPAASERVDETLTHYYKSSGGEPVDYEIEACESIMKVGKLCRDYEVLILNNNLKRIAQGAAPEKPDFTSPVSAATHLGAARDHKKLCAERSSRMDDAGIATADYFEHEHKQKAAQTDREARKDSVPTEAAPRKEAAMKPATPEQSQPNAPPKKNATSQVA
jgi:hypothetical protein